MLEAVDRFERLMGKKLQIEYVDQNRVGDHICYISDLRRIRADYPEWDLQYGLDRTFEEISAA